ncbi:MAG: AraC-like DNA-binding protein [Kiritimatiellia bacterium]|jgi:AraC-like DNA-binding protein
MMKKNNDILARTSHLSIKENSHSHEHHQIIIGIAGEADFEIEGVGGKIDGYSGCIVPSNERHSFYGSDENSVFILDIGKDLINSNGLHSVAGNDLSRMFDSRRYFSIDQQMHLMLFSLVNEIKVYADDPSMKPLVAELVLRGLSNRLSSNSSNIEHRIHGDRLDLNMIQQYIHAHIADKIQVSELAQLCDLSASHFYQKFRDKTGVSPHQYLILERIKVARFLLGNTNKNLTDICFSLGFSSQSAFTNTFTKKVGCSPSHYRNSLR